MSNSSELQSELARILPGDAARALAQVGLPVIAPEDVVQHIARLTEHSSPSYLPFATFDGSPLAIHLSPGRDVLDSPVVYFSTGSRTPKFVCGNFRDLALGVWLWIAQYFKDRQVVLRSATDALATAIPGARSVPDSLWSLLQTAPDYEPTWWGYGASQETTVAWTLAAVGHPYAELGTVDDKQPGIAAGQLDAYASAHSNAAPQILAALISAQMGAAEPPNQDHIVRVLSAEAWLGDVEVVRAIWMRAEGGLNAWSIALHAALSIGGFLDLTPFAPLVGHGAAYSGKDPRGPKLLVEVADRFASLGNSGGEVCQLRNAAVVSLLTYGAYPKSLCDRIADACDNVSPNALAATCARAYRDAQPSDA